MQFSYFEMGQNLYYFLIISNFLRSLFIASAIIFQKAVESSSDDKDGIFGKVVDDKATEVREWVGEVLVSRILLAGWQRIVETLINTIALAGMPVDASSTGFASFFAARKPSMIPVNHVKEK